MTAQGSGFLITVDSNNYILTSMHVVAGSMMVLAFDDDRVTACQTLLKFGKSSALCLDSFVVTLGHPFGVQGTVTLGMLSGRTELPAFDPSSATAMALTAAVTALVIFVAKALQWWRGKTTPTDAKEEYGGLRTWTSAIQVATGGRLLPQHGG
jgi:S1-C subfamily serine protease